MIQTLIQEALFVKADGQPQWKGNSAAQALVPIHVTGRGVHCHAGRCVHGL